MFFLVHSSGHSAKVPALITNLKLATTQAQLPVLALEGVEFNGRGMSCCFFCGVDQWFQAQGAWVVNVLVDVFFFFFFSKLRHTSLWLDDDVVVVVVVVVVIVVVVSRTSNMGLFWPDFIITLWPQDACRPSIPRPDRWADSSGWTSSWHQGDWLAGEGWKVRVEIW